MVNSFFDQPIEKLKGIGPYYLKRLQKLKLKTFRDFLRHYPSRYEDFSNLKKVSEIAPGEVCSVLAKIQKIKTRKSFRKRLFITEAVLEDNSGQVPAVWFGQPFLMKSLKQGLWVIVSGKVMDKAGKLEVKNFKPFFQSPAFEIVSREENFVLDDLHFEKLKHTAGLIPVYPETAGLTSRGLRYFLKPLIDSASQQKDFLPPQVLEKTGLLEFGLAVKQLHFPESYEMAEKARQRFAFEEIFLTQFLLLEQRHENAVLKAPQIPLAIELVKTILGKLSFELTKTQKQALWEIIKDLNREFPMNRLLNGDVGSGKTIVALIALACCVKAGWQGVFLAPTEILARQHFRNAKKLLENLGIELALLVGKEARIASDGLEGEIKKPSLKKMIFEGRPILVIGTQAVLQKSVDFSKLGLVVVDEQHRFGVKQRAQLVNGPQVKSSLVSHFLSMSATPIPRTLALGLWGDLDISIISEMPAGRKKIMTEIVDSGGREKMYQFIRERIKQGEQVFVICPRIEKLEDVASDGHRVQLDFQKWLGLDTKAVKEEFERLSREVFPDLKLGLLHGRMKPNEKDKVMAEFSANKINILVSTSVIEVGIDVPNATVMVIEGADRFGLAQLHQFRGRVGRGEKQSYCFLLSENMSQIAQKRLSAFAEFFDGFKLAEEDLKLRGPGEFFGVRQSGIPDIATEAFKDINLIILARRLAEACFPKLDKLPLLRNEIESFRQRVHLE